MSKRGNRNYDKVMRENLVRPSDGLLRYLLSSEIVEVIPLPPRIRQTIVEKETDTLVQAKIKGKKPFILHLEFQSTNDGRMPRRMAAYDHMLHLTYNLEVVSIVIYIGEKNMWMRNSVAFNGNYYKYKLIDIRDIDPELFLESDNAREIILAVLAGNNETEKELIIKRILIKLQLLLPGSQSELSERIKEMQILSGLRSGETQKLIIKELKNMPIVYDIRKMWGYKEGRAAGKADGRAAGEAEGRAAGEASGKAAAQAEVVKNLLQHTSHSIEEIAKLVKVSKKFVLAVQKDIAGQDKN